MVPDAVWYGLELREVRAFLVLAEELHFGRTAERLGVTQSRVSQTIRELEARVGARVFDRTSRRVALTPVGEALRGGMAPAYAQMRRAFEEAREAAEELTGVVRIGMYNAMLGGAHLLEIVRALEARHPACRAEVVETDWAHDQLDWLRRGDADVLVMRLPLHAAEVEIGPVLGREERVVAVARDHPLAERASVAYEDLGDYVVSDVPALPDEMMEAFVPPRTPSGRVLRRLPSRSQGELMLRIVTGQIVHPTVRSFIDFYRHPDMVGVPVRDLPPSEIALVWLRGGRSRKVTELVRAADDVLGAQP